MKVSSIEWMLLLMISLTIVFIVFHHLPILYLRPMLHQIHTDLVYGIFDRSILWLVRRTTNNMVPALSHGLVNFRHLVQG